MLTNRSMPSATVIPVLGYDDVRTAVAWLCAAFGFHERLRIASHRSQLAVGDGALVVTGGGPPTGGGQAVMVRVDDVDAHHLRAVAAGARVLSAPIDHPYGERQYEVADLAGHRWTFSQTIADVDPPTWGGALVEPG